MLEEHISNMDLSQGFKLLERKRFEEAIAYFTEHLDADSQAHYGLATAKFRKLKETALQDEGATQKIISLYERSIELDPDFADSYLMLGMAYETKTNYLLKEKRETREGEIRESIQNSQTALERAKELNLNFKKIVDAELKQIERQKKFLESWHI
jgi:tetratricopeptide (TPR) repeat protein